MNLRGLRRVPLALVLAIGLAAPAEPSEPASLHALSWLAGCWENRQTNRLTEDEWMSPRGGMMLGVSRTVVDGKTVEFEHMRIEEKDGKLVFTAKPSGQAEASFVMAGLTDSSVVFSNPEHDFPQRIIYRQLPDGSLVARIEGERDGKARAVDYPMKRTPCEEP